MAVHFSLCWTPGETVGAQVVWWGEAVKVQLNCRMLHFIYEFILIFIKVWLANNVIFASGTRQ